jgi:hypothetical protein
MQPSSCRPSFIDNEDISWIRCRHCLKEDIDTSEMLCWNGVAGQAAAEEDWPNSRRRDSKR